jgi:hypothetical protein
MAIFFEIGRRNGPCHVARRELGDMLAGRSRRNGNNAPFSRELNGMPALAGREGRCA